MGCGSNWKDYNYDVFDRQTNKFIKFQPKSLEDCQNMLQSDQYAVHKVKKAQNPYAQLTKKYSDTNKTWVDQDFPPNSKSIGNAQLTYVPQWKRIPQILKDAQFMVNDASPSDIIQGGIGDCYLLSSVSALAQNPQRIKRLFPDTSTHHDTGVYMVKMKLQGVKQQICVDDYIPVDHHGRPAFIQPHGRQFWTLILEKAWAKAHGSYGSIIGGLPHQCLNALSSAPTQFHSIPRQPYSGRETQQLEHIWKQLEQGQKNDWAMCCGTIVDEQIEKYGLVLGHAYTLLGAYQLPLQNRTTQRLIKLRNPWGKRQWKGRFSDNDNQSWNLVNNMDKKKIGYTKGDEGIFFMGWDQFIHYFDMVDVCKINESFTLEFQQVQQKKSNGQIFKLDIKNQGKVFLTLHQKDLRGLPSYAEKLGYARTTIVIGKLIGKNQYRYVDSLNDNRFADTQMELKLQQGTYIVFGKCDWVRQSPDKFTLSVYSQTGACITKQTQSDQKDFLKKVFFNYAQTHQEGKRYLTNSQQDWIMIHPLFHEGGYGIIAANSINTSVIFTANQVDFNKVGWKLKNPEKGDKKIEKKSQPGKPFILLSRMIDNFPTNLVKFPPVHNVSLLK